MTVQIRARCPARHRPRRRLPQQPVHLQHRPPGREARLDVRRPRAAARAELLLCPRDAERRGNRLEQPGVVRGEVRVRGSGFGARGSGFGARGSGLGARGSGLGVRGSGSPPLPPGEGRGEGALGKNAAGRPRSSACLWHGLPACCGTVSRPVSRPRPKVSKGQSWRQRPIFLNRLPREIFSSAAAVATAAQSPGLEMQLPKSGDLPPEGPYPLVAARGPPPYWRKGIAGRTANDLAVTGSIWAPLGVLGDRANVEAEPGGTAFPQIPNLGDNGIRGHRRSQQFLRSANHRGLETHLAANALDLRVFQRCRLTRSPARQAHEKSRP